MRSIWHTVLKDLLSVKPLPYSRSDVEAMSASQLRDASIRIVKIDMACTTPSFLPRREVLPDMEYVPFMRNVHLLAGGTKYLYTTADHHLHLCKMDLAPSKPVATLAYPEALRGTVDCDFHTMSLDRTYISRSSWYFG